MYESKLNNPEVDELYRAILTLTSVEECYRFFDDVATIGEVQAMAQRMRVARLLDEGMKYADIASATGASTATISRVSRCLTYGADGYRAVIRRLKEQETEKGDIIL